MGLAFPRATFAEFYLNGWTDVTNYVRQTAPITVTRGRTGEQGQTAPSQLTARLNNSSGNMDPDNPNGIYYGLLGRNTPVRWGIYAARDVFARTVSNGWGSTEPNDVKPTSDAWTIGASTADYSVGLGVGKHVMPTASTSRFSYLAGLIDLQDYEVMVDITLSTPGAGSNAGGLLLRGQSTSNAIYVQFLIDSTGAAQLAVWDLNTTTLIDTPVAVPGVTGGTNRVHAAIEGRTLRVKAWNSATQSEPYTWNTTVVLTTPTFDDIAGAGWPGLYSQSGVGNTNVTVTYDNFWVRLTRFAGEISSLLPRADASHKDRYVELDAGGITRRMRQGGKKSVKTAIQRLVEKTSPLPVEFFTLEDDALVTTGVPSIGTGSATIDTSGSVFFGVTPGKFWAQGKNSVWLNNTVSLNQATQIRVGFPKLLGSSRYTADFVVSFYGDPNNAPDSIAGGAVDNDFIVDFNPTNKTVDFRGALVTDTLISKSAIYDGLSHHFRVQLVQSGGNVNATLFIDGVSAITSSVAGTLAGINNVNFNTQFGDFKRALGYVAVYGDAGAPNVTPLASAAYAGLAGETAGARFVRIASEENLLYLTEGDLTASMAMGPQSPLKPLDLLQECADTDAGTFYEPRSITGVALRTRASAYNQTPALTLDYSLDGHVSPPLERGPDDKNTRNRITVKRANGSQYVAEQKTGPLNTNDPWSDPNGVGVYDQQVTVNCQTDALLPGLANWLLHLGTVPESRFPKITVLLHKVATVSNGGALQAQALGVNNEDRMIVNNAQAINVYEPIDQIVHGYTEVMVDEMEHRISYNTAPYSPYKVPVLGSSRLDTDDSTLAAGFTAGLGLPFTISVATAGAALWTTAGGDFPLDIMIAGQRLTLSGISGASSPQTFTVSARPTGVDKAQVAGAKVSLADPVYLG